MESTATQPTKVNEVTLTDLRNQYSQTVTSINTEQDKLTRLNSTIREAKASGDASRLRQTLSEANESKLLLDALREHAQSLQPQISVLEQQEAAKREQLREKAKVENLVEKAQKAEDTKKALSECDKKITSTLRELILERGKLNAELKADITAFFELGQKYVPSFFELYAQSTGSAISSEARALLQEVKAETETDALFVAFGELGGRAWQSLGDSRTFPHLAYPINDTIASQLPPMMHHVTRQQFAHLQPVALEELK